MVTMRVRGPILITAELEQKVRVRLAYVRKEAHSAALGGFPTLQERMHGQEDALNWLLNEANCKPGWDAKRAEEAEC